MKKNLVLKSVEENEKRGLLSLEQENDIVQGQLRLYGFSSEPRGILSLGLTTPQGVVKAGLTKQASMLFTFSLQLDIIPDVFSCAVVNFSGGELAPLLFGSVGEKSLEEKLSMVTQALKDTKTTNEVEDVLDELGLDYEDELKNDIEKEIDKQLQKTCDCENCVYKKYFYENQTNADTQVQTIKKSKVIEIEQQEEKSFFNEIKNQVATLFEQNKAEEFLQNAIPNSKWVKVEIEQGGDYYVFGLIYDDEQLRYICYGVPSLYSPLPPKNLSGYPVWFPVDKNKKEGFGYWLTYQDAGTGESVKAIIE